MGETETVVEYLREQETYYRKRGARSRILYQLVNTILILLSSALPIIVLAAPSTKIIQAVIAAIIGALAAINSFFHFRENWIKNTNAAEALSLELIKFKTKTGKDYDHTLGHRVAESNLMAHYEAIAEVALREWRTIVSTAPDQVPTQDEKP